MNTFESILALDDEVILARLVHQLTSSNPHLKLGERLLTPTAPVWQGKVVDLMPKTEGVISLDYAVPHVPIRHETVTCTVAQIHFDRLLDFELSHHGHIYPRSVHIPHRGWLSKHEVGDVVQVLDEQYDMSPVTLTKQHFIDHSYLVFRFALGT